MIATIDVGQVLAAIGCANFGPYIMKGGRGEHIWVALNEKNKQVSASTLLEWCIIETRGAWIENFLRSNFNEVHLQEHFQAYYKFRIDKEPEKSIGYMFGLIESNKVAYKISEYSLSQTSLEQIFNHFAK